MRIGLFLGVAALAMTAPASAAWQQASSKHFVIYGDMTTEEMTAYAAKLEMFDAAARLVRKMGDPIDPRSTEALIYKGRAILARAKKAQDPALFKAARQQFSAANKLDAEDPEALFLYYRTYRAANQLAPKSALDALTYAVALAPRDSTVAVQLVLEHMRQKNWKGAADALRPLAYMPHAGQSAQNKALAVLKLLDANQGPAAMTMAEKEFLPKKDENPN